MTTPELIEQKLEKIISLINKQAAQIAEYEKAAKLHRLQIETQCCLLASRSGMTSDDWKKLSKEAKNIAEIWFLEQSHRSTNPF